LAAADTVQLNLFACVVTPRLLVHPDVQLSPGVAPYLYCSDVGRLHYLEVFPFDLISSQAWGSAALSCSGCLSVLWECDWAHACCRRQLRDPGGTSAACAEIGPVLTWSQAAVENRESGGLAENYVLEWESGVTCRLFRIVSGRFVKDGWMSLLRGSLRGSASSADQCGGRRNERWFMKAKKLGD
jgi:hypothetical protein